MFRYKINWKGTGINTKGFDGNGKCIMCNKMYFRPSEVDYLIGNYNKAKKLLKWKPKISFKALVKEMVFEDYNNLKAKYKTLKKSK